MIKEETILKIQELFKDKLTVYDESMVNCSLYGLSETDKQILFKIGLPEYKGLGGNHIPVKELNIESYKYIKLYTREGEEDTYGRYINVNNNEVVFKNTIGNKKAPYRYINKDLESYLKYLFIYQDFRQNVKIPEALGSYWGTKENEEGNHEKYAAELKRRFLEINGDVEKSYVWTPLIEEMDLGVI